MHSFTSLSAAPGKLRDMWVFDETPAENPLIPGTLPPFPDFKSLYIELLGAGGASGGGATFGGGGGASCGLLVRSRDALVYDCRPGQTLPMLYVGAGAALANGGDTVFFMDPWDPGTGGALFTITAGGGGSGGNDGGGGVVTASYREDYRYPNFPLLSRKGEAGLFDMQTNRARAGLAVGPLAGPYMLPAADAYGRGGDPATTDAGGNGRAVFYFFG